MSVSAFDRSIETSAGFGSYVSRSLPQLMRGISHGTEASLGKPDVFQQRIVVATDCSESSNYLLFVDGEEMFKLRSDRLAMAVHPLTQPIRDVRWLDFNNVVCATGAHQLMIFRLDDSGMVSTVKSVDNVHNGAIREIAVKHINEGLVASGGFDGILNVVDMTGAGPLQRAVLNNKVISSVKWTDMNSNVCVSVTTDDGDYYMFDTRGDMSKAAVNVNLIKADLFTHCRYTDHHVLLGYGDGEMKQIDMRKPQDIICSVTDPYVEGIGGIEFNHTSQSFAVSGFTDCSVWKLNADGIATVASHTMSGSNVLMNENGYSTAAAYYRPDCVVVSDSAGRIAIFEQSF